MRIGKITQPLVVHTYRQPLSVNLSIRQVEGRPLTQWTIPARRIWYPDREVTELVLAPDVSVVNTDTGEVVPFSSMDVAWYLVANQKIATSSLGGISGGRDPGGSFTPIDGSQGRDDTMNDVREVVTRIIAVHEPEGTTAPYSVGDDNYLYVRQNITEDNPQTILCKVTFTDPSGGGTRTLSEHVVLSASNLADDIFRVVIDSPFRQNYDPFGNVHEVSFHARVIRGTDEESNVGFVWYINGWEASDTYSDSAYLGYIIGQGTDTLTIDARFATHVTVTARAGLLVNGAIPSTGGTRHFIPSAATCAVVWKLPRLAGEVVPLGGSVLRNSNDRKLLRLMVRRNGSDYTDTEGLQLLRVQWKKMAATGATNETVLGYGHELAVDGASLAQTGGVSISPDVTIAGPLTAVADASGKIVIDASGKIVVGRVFTT